MTDDLDRIWFSERGGSQESCMERLREEARLREELRRGRREEIEFGEFDEGAQLLRKCSENPVCA